MFAPRPSAAKPQVTKEGKKGKRLRSKAERQQRRALSVVETSDDEPMREDDAAWLLAANGRMLQPPALNAELLLGLVAQGVVAGTVPGHCAGPAHAVHDGIAWATSEDTRIAMLPMGTQLTVQLHMMLEQADEDYNHGDAAQLVADGAVLSPWEAGSESVGMEAVEASALGGQHVKLARMGALGLDLDGWRNTDGWSLLHVVCGKTHQSATKSHGDGLIETAKMLLEHGANASAQTPSGRTAAMLAALLFPAATYTLERGESWATQMFPLLSNAGMDLDVADEDGHTLLHLAVRTHDVWLVIMLRNQHLEKGGVEGWGAVAGRADLFGQSALHLVVGHLTLTVVASKRTLLHNEATGGGEHCERRLLTVYEDAVKAAQEAKMVGIQHRMMEREALPGFDVLQTTMRAWRDGERTFADLRRELKTVLPSAAGRELFLKDIHAMMPPVSSAKGMSKRRRELERVVTITALDSDPLGCVGISQQAVLRARAKCEYNTHTLSQLLRDGGDNIAAALQAKDNLNHTVLFVAAQVGASDAVQVLLDAGSTVSADERHAAAASGCGDCSDLLGDGMIIEDRDMWWTEPSQRWHDRRTTDDEAGSWAGPVHNKLTQQLSEWGCDGRIAVRQSVSWPELRDEFITVGRPVLMLEPFDEATAESEREAWSLPMLRRRFGGTPVMHSTIPYAAQFGLGDDENEVELQQRSSCRRKLSSRGARPAAGNLTSISNMSSWQCLTVVVLGTAQWLRR